MPTIVNPVWRPSTARRLVIDDFVPAPRGTAPSAPAPLQWPAKDPSDQLDYELDISPALYGNDRDSIRTIDVTIAPNVAGDLQLVSAQADGPRAIFWFAAGGPGRTYTVTVVIGTANGRVLARDVLLPCLALSTAEIGPDTLVTETGAAITDQTGTPLQS